MILFNQCQDPFDPNFQLKETPSQIMDKKYLSCEEELSNLSGIQYTKKRFELERKYQQTFLEEEIDQLLQYALHTIKLIKEIRKRQDIPMVNLDFFDLRDFPKMYSECLSSYIAIYGKKPEIQLLNEFHMQKIEVNSMYVLYGIPELKHCYSSFSKLLSSYSKLEALVKEVTDMMHLVGIPGDALLPIIKPTLASLSGYITQISSQTDFFNSVLDDLHREHTCIQFDTALKNIGTHNTIVFATAPCSRYNFEEVPEMNDTCTGFIVTTDSPESVKQDFLKRIKYSKEYYVEYYSLSI